MSTSIFTQIINKEIPADIIYEDNDVIAFLDIAPNNPGHTLVVPKQDTLTILTATDNQLEAIIRIVKKITPFILESVGATDFNLHVNNGSIAGQVVPHLHFHIIPRFINDGLKHWHGTGTSPQKDRKQLAFDIRGKIKKLNQDL